MYFNNGLNWECVNSKRNLVVMIMCIYEYWKNYLVGDFVNVKSDVQFYEKILVQHQM